MGHARLHQGTFSIDAVLQELTTPQTGGVACYVGTVRGDDDGRPVARLTYEAFPEMAQPELERLRAETIQRFRLLDGIILHRTGTIPAGHPILLVAFSARHRKEAFAALDHFMDELKTRIPIWKKESGPEGATWILGPENQRVKP